MEKVKRLAHLINNFFCVIEVLIIVFIFVYCLIFYDKVTFNNEEEQKLYVSKRIFVFTFVVSSIIFVCSVIAVFAVFIIKCFKHSINRYLGDKYPGGVEKEMFKNKIPASADYLISLGLANTLIGLYIGIDNQDIGDYVFIKDLALGVGLMTVLMTVFDRIITYLLYFSLLDNKVDHLEILILKSAHCARFVKHSLIEYFIRLFMLDTAWHSVSWSCSFLFLVKASTWWWWFMRRMISIGSVLSTY